MHIKVKGVNNHLVFVLDDNQDFNSLMNELESLLESPLLKSDGYYPRAFFDFKSRILSIHELLRLLDLLFSKQVLLFDGINMAKVEKKNKIIMRRNPSGGYPYGQKAAQVRRKL